VTFRIDRLRPDDWRRWRMVRVQALEADPAAFACSAHVLGAQASEQQWRDGMADRTIFVARPAHGPDVAMVGVTHAEVPELISMWVAPPARGSGLGRLLVDAVLAEAGGRPVELRVMADNAAAIAFYERCGFALLTREADDEGTLRMRRDARRATAAWPAPAARTRRPGAPPPGPTADQ